MSFNKRMLSAGAAPFVPGENFKVVTWTGNGGTQSITGVGFKPDWVWIKRRSDTENHSIMDSTRGAQKELGSNRTNAEHTTTNGLSSFDTDGFTVGANNGQNTNNETYVAWCWKAGGGTTSTNSNGSINSTVQANQDSGFSIVQYDGTGSAATIGHGLSSAPELIITKQKTGTTSWSVGVSDWTKYLELDDTPAFRTASSVWNNTAPTSTVFSVAGSGGSNTSGGTNIAYCFHSVDSFSKIGTYTGNGSTNGPVVETGFEPAFLMVKNTTSADNWAIFDNKRNTSNPRNTMLQANLDAADNSEVGAVINFYSNGFQSVGTGGGGGSGQVNKNNNVYIYMAFAADPDEEAPTLASSFNVETFTGDSRNNRPYSGLGFQPDLVWIKRRNSSESHALYDSLRGPNEQLSPDTNAAIAVNSGDYLGLSSFDSDGFTIGNNGGTNRNPNTYVGWAWKADDNEPTINTNGTGIDSTTSVNDAAGFSIVSYTGTGNASHTVGHGLSSAPKFLLNKSRDNGQGWAVVHNNLSSGHNLGLHSNAAETNSMGNDGSITKGDVGATTFGFTAGASTVNGANLDGNRYITYCFTDVAGYQKFGTYNGTGGSLTITTGFKPDFVMIKRTDASGSWVLLDSPRDGGDTRLYADLANAEDTGQGESFVSTGFKPRSSTTNDTNTSGGTYIYWAVAKNVPSNTTLASSFNAAFYTGSSTSRSISTFGFRPDLVWIKKLSATDLHVWTDSVRGNNQQLFSNQTDAQSVSTTRLTSFDANGFGLDGTSSNRVNGSANSFVAWGWKAGNTWQSNLTGTIPSIVNANTANGFSIVKYTGIGADGTVGHGLSATPDLLIVKGMETTNDWSVLHKDGTDNNFLQLNGSSAESGDGSIFGSTFARPTSTVFTIGNTGETGTDNKDYIAYCWHSVSGYSKISSYDGTGSTNAITGLGFAPDWVMIKEIDGSDSWQVYDSLRGAGNVVYPNGDNAQYAGSELASFDSNGFTVSGNSSNNESGKKYLYMTFAKNTPNNNTLANSFKTKLITGNGSSQEITGIGFKPDLVWIKQRSDTNPHGLWDTTRGAGKLLVSATTAVETGNAGNLLGYFLDDGFQINRNYLQHTAYDNTNYSSATYVAWCWKAGNGWQSNTTGGVSSLTNANTGNKFSVVRYKGTGSATTVGHDLGAAPTFIIAKTVESVAKWRVYHSTLGGTKALNLSDSDAAGTSANYWNDTAPTSSVFSVGSDLSPNGEDVIAYCWSDVTGYSKFGNYTGNGNSTGPSVTLGFQADWILIKRYDAVEDWKLIDSVRGFANTLEPNENGAEESNNNSNFTISSTGFQIGDTHGDFNANNGTYVYMAFKMN